MGDVRGGDGGREGTAETVGWSSRMGGPPTPGNFITLPPYLQPQQCSVLLLRLTHMALPAR